MISETNFHGRGHPGNRNGEHLHLAEPGFVFCISLTIGKQAFVWGYTRLFQMDEWGIRANKVFRRCSASALTSSWAEPVAEEALIFRPAFIQVIPEEAWMGLNQ